MKTLTEATAIVPITFTKICKHMGKLEEFLGKAKKDLKWKEPQIIRESTLRYFFERVDVPEEESGGNPFHYYILDIGDICLISNDHEEAEQKGWEVQIFDFMSFTLRAEDDLIILIDLLKSNTKSDHDTDHDTDHEPIN